MSSVRPRRLLLKLGLSLAVCLLFIEAALHLFPTLVPASYRGAFPLHGVGFFHPDLLDETAVEDMPLPLYVGDYSGPPPSDLIEIGLAPSGAGDADAARWGDVELRVDALGLPNASIPDTVDVVLVGDSFAVSAGVQQPPGLVRRFEEETGLSVYNVGVAAIGSFQERFLLASHGLPKQPRVVVWMFFGGNDVQDVLTTLYQKRLGHATWGDVHADRRPPALRLPAILRHLRGRRIDAAKKNPLEGLRLVAPQPNGTGAAQDVGRELWMHPNYLLTLTRTRADWESDPAFVATLEVLHEAAAAVEAAGAKLLFVYLPSKAQALLPVVEQDAQRIYTMANHGRAQPQLTPESFLPTALANANALETLLLEDCAARGIAFLSATPILAAAARAGEPCYLAADTHWDLQGHEELLPALIESVEALLD